MLKDCPKCGKPVRLGAYRITINRKHGVGHYIIHMDGSPMHNPGWDCITLKPIPRTKLTGPGDKCLTAGNPNNRVCPRSAGACRIQTT
jgi:hypothetical protein